MSEIKVTDMEFFRCVPFDAFVEIFDSIYHKPRATVRSRMAENMRHRSSYLVSVSKNGGKSHDKADVGRRKVASTAVRARGSARICVPVYTYARVCACVRA